MKRSLELVGLGLFICLAPGGLALGQVAINVSPTLPSDIDIAGGAPAATLQQAAAFAWQEFIALNWPAMAGQRDVADQNQKFGAGAGPLVWETFPGKAEIFNLTKDDAGNYVPPGYSATAPEYGYNTPPVFLQNQISAGLSRTDRTRLASLGQHRRDDRDRARSNVRGRSCHPR
jgi:hypothetical protein